MKFVRGLVAVFAISLMAQVGFANTSYTPMEQCPNVVKDVVSKYFDVANVDAKLRNTIWDTDELEVLEYKSTTPGSYNQQYRAVIKIKYTPDHLRYTQDALGEIVELKLTGDFDCDGLKVKSVRSRGVYTKTAGGVERVD